MNPSHRGEGCNNFLHAREEGEARTHAVWRLGPLAVGSWDLSLAWPTEPTISHHICSNHFVQFSILSIVGELWSCSVNFCSIVSGWVNFLLNYLTVQKCCCWTGICSIKHLFNLFWWVLPLFKWDLFTGQGSEIIIPEGEVTSRGPLLKGDYPVSRGVGGQNNILS